MRKPTPWRAAFRAHPFRRRGYTRTDLVVAIVIVAILLGLGIILLRSSREVARQQVCRDKIIQLAAACAKYELTAGALPMGVDDPGEVIRNEPAGLHRGWMISILPYLEEAPVYERIDHDASVYAEENADVRAMTIHGYLCPVGTRVQDRLGHSDYAGMHHHEEAPIGTDNLGLLYLRSAIRSELIPDGKAHTLLIGEKRTLPGDLGWMSGTRATLRNAGTPLNKTTEALRKDTSKSDSLLWVGGFGSYHPAGVVFAYADGRDDLLSPDIDRRLYQQIAHRSDGQRGVDPASAP